MKNRYKSLIALLSLSAILTTAIPYHKHTVQATSESLTEQGDIDL